MPAVKKESVYIEITPSEAVESKRNLLEIQLYLLNIIRNLLSLKELTKVELSLKKEISSKIKEVEHIINQNFNILPVEEVLSVKEGKTKRMIKFEEKSPFKGKRAKIDMELREIKQKLAGLAQ